MSRVDAVTTENGDTKLFPIQVARSWLCSFGD